MSDSTIRVVVYVVLAVLFVWGVARRRARRANMTLEQRQMEDLTAETRALRREMRRSRRW